ncbi:MAG: hypothetical protein IKL53_02740 [Lachnospiraceae bacterium]|nr:hypothetical protein [Lachnospiraceae bacterium]
MFRVWGKTIKNNKTTADHVACIEDYTLNRTKKVYMALEEICNKLDMAVPIWLDLNKKEFICHAKTRFTQDSFIETIEFDYLEFQVIEEDY